MSLRKRAEFLVDEVDGLTLDDVDEVYEEWAGMDFDRSNFGYDQALASLWAIAYKKSLKRLGHYKSYKERIRTLVEQKEQK
jgi:hypothetical protein